MKVGYFTVAIALIFSVLSAYNIFKDGLHPAFYLISLGAAIIAAVVLTIELLKELNNNDKA
jgi:uncharacterized membrane protein YvlD (DUF360 family)